MKQSLFALLLCCFVHSAFAQTIPIGTSDTLCPGDQLGITTAGFDSSTMILLNNPTTVNLNDDEFSGLISIGFNFQFYGNTYSQLVLGSNGVVSFNASAAGTWCSWNPAIMLPNFSTPNKNCIFAPWADMLVQSGQLKYELLGTAPNRKFVIYYKSPFTYGSNCGTICWSSTIVLYETTNEIDIFLRDKPLCSSAVEGLHNATGTIAHIVPGRTTGNSWTCGFDGKKFTPTGPGYTIQNTLFQPVIDGPYTLVWTDTQGNQFPFSDTLTITGAIGPDKGYFIGMVDSSFCSLVPALASDVSWIDMLEQAAAYTTVDDFCGTGSGIFYSADSATTDNSYYWPTLGLSNDTLTTLAAGTYPFVFTGENGCQSQDTIAITSLPLLSLSVTTTPETLGTDGTAEITASGGTPSYFFLLDSLLQTNGQFTGLTAGMHTCYVADQHGCVDSINFTIQSVVGLPETVSDDPSFFPNPASDYLIFTSLKGEYEVIVQDLLGQNCLIARSQNQDPIHLESLSSGMYQLIIRQDGRSFSGGRLVKE